MELEGPLTDLLTPMGLRLYDLELSAGTLNVVIQRDGGVTLDELAEASRVISRWLDEHDPIAGHYTLDVSSPGLERRLRTATHFASAVGEVVTLRERRPDAPTRRLEGVLLAADADTVTVDDREVGSVRVAIDAVERARTVFTWGAASEPPSGRRTASPSKKG